MSSTADVSEQGHGPCGNCQDKAALELAERGYLYSKKYDKSRLDEDLREAVSCCEKALRLSSLENSHRPRILDSLSRRLLQRYQRFHQPTDLEDAVSWSRSALQSTGPQDPMRASIRSGLSRALMETYKADSRNMSHLEEAIQLAREAISECPHDETNNLAGRKMTLAANLSLLYDATKEERHLDEAIQYNREAVRSTEKGNPMRSARLCNLGNTIGKKYNRTNDIKDLKESLEYNRQAKRLIPYSTDQANWINIINSYSVRLLWHFERCGERKSLDKSLKWMQELVNTTPRDHPMWNQCTRNLCNRLITRYEVGNEQRDLHDAIERAEDAVSQCSSMRNIVDKALTFYTLCLTIRARYRTTGALTDLTAAVEYANQAVKLIPSEHIEYASVLQNKSLTLLMLYERHKDPSDLDEAIRSGEASAAVVIHRDRQAMTYTNLGILYGYRWMLGGKKNDKDLEMAIAYCRKTLGLQLREPGGLVNLANWLLATQKRDALDEAIALAEEAFGMMDEVPDHPDRARVAHTLAEAWEFRYRSRGKESDGGAEDRRRAKEVLRAVMARAAGKSPPADRIQLALFLASIALSEGDWTGVYQAATAAVQLLPLLSPRCIKQSDQQHALLQFAGLAGRAAAAALEANRGAPEALRLLECGRCVISGHRFERRVDVGRLRGTHADLAQRFEDLCSVLDADDGLSLDSAGAVARLSHRHRADVDLTNLIDEIRRETGSPDFLAPVEPVTLLVGKPRSAIVVINIAFRSDVFLIRESRVEPLPLKQLSIAEVQRRAGLFAAKIDRRGPVPQDIHEELEWLWDAVVGPILHRLGVDGPPSPGEEWPRVCWVPTGPLSRLPLHAAGYHRDGSQRTALDRVVSSYSPSIKFLQYAAENQRKLPRPAAQRPSQQALIASMPFTPRMADLEHAPLEAEAVGKLLARDMTVKKVRTPSWSSLTQELQHCTIFHFAGHGKADAVDPLRSALAVDDGHVTVNDLIDLKLHLEPPLLAYLSACRTGNVQVDGLVDEGIHLAASFLAAGFRNVIAALWRVRDSDSASLAEIVYRHMVGVGLEDHSIPLALHMALREIRGTETTRPDDGRGASRPRPNIEPPNPGLAYSWISYIHLGLF